MRILLLLFRAISFMMLSSLSSNPPSSTSTATTTFCQAVAIVGNSNEYGGAGTGTTTTYKTPSVIVSENTSNHDEAVQSLDETTQRRSSEEVCENGNNNDSDDSMIANDDDEDDDDDYEEDVVTHDDGEEEEQQGNRGRLIVPQVIFAMDPTVWKEIWDEGDLGWLSEAVGCPGSDRSGTDEPHSFGRIPTAESTWDILFEAYHATVPKEMATIPLDGYKGASFFFPVEVKAIPYKGRGVFSKSFIPSGSKVWQFGNTAQFPTRKHFEDFYLYLVERYIESSNNHDKTKPNVSNSVICDALMWSYTAETGYVRDGDTNSGFTYQNCIDFDEGSMINKFVEGFSEQNVEERTPEFNDDGSEFFGCQGGTIYAIKDINPGEGTCIFSRFKGSFLKGSERMATTLN
jgi:hypothetical protein